MVTVWFLPVLWTLPSFLANLVRLSSFVGFPLDDLCTQKQQGVETNTLVRLTTYHEMNVRCCLALYLLSPDRR